MLASNQNGASIMYGRSERAFNHLDICSIWVWIWCRKIHGFGEFSRIFDEMEKNHWESADGSQKHRIWFARLGEPLGDARRLASRVQSIMHSTKDGWTYPSGAHMWRVLQRVNDTPPTTWKIKQSESLFFIPQGDWKPPNTTITVTPSESVCILKTNWWIFTDKPKLRTLTINKQWLFF